jgi:hypothetical protein
VEEVYIMIGGRKVWCKNLCDITDGVEGGESS